MSADEQAALIGQLVLERQQIYGERDLLKGEIDTITAKLCALHDDFMKTGFVSSQREDDTGKMKISLKTINELIDGGGLDRLRKLVSDYIELGNKVLGIAKKLKDAGAE